MPRRKGDTCAPPLVRLARRSEQVGDCWVWRGWTDRQGYGYFQATSGATVAVHRFAYREFVGPVPDGLQLDHLCRTPACWNFTHLDPVPCRVNLHRSPLWIGNRARSASEVAA